MAQSSLRIYHQNRLTRSQIEEALAKLTGEIVQIPPMYSAVKVNGESYMNMHEKGLKLKDLNGKCTFMKSNCWILYNCMKGRSYVPYSNCMWKRDVHPNTCCSNRGITWLSGPYGSTCPYSSGTYRASRLPDTGGSESTSRKRDKLQRLLRPLEDALS